MERNAMPTTLVSIYDRLPAADNARNELLACGFDIDAVHLSAQEDEAGAMKSNFTVGNPDRATGEKRGRFGPDKDNQTYARGYAHPRQHAEILLTVDAADEQQSRKAIDILHRYGAIRIDQNMH
jgi:hypothetical protein